MASDTLTIRTLMVENNRLKDEIKDLEDDLSHLRLVIRALNRIQYSLDTITAESDVMSLIHTILSAALDAVSSENGSLLLYDPELHELVFIEVIGQERDHLLGLRMPASQGIAGWTLMEKSPALVAEAAFDSRWFSEIDDSIEFDTGSMMSVPLLDADRPLGVLQVVNPRMADHFDADDLDILLLVARLASLVLVRAEHAGPGAEQTTAS